MRKLIIGVAALGAVIALRSVARHTAEKMREHCHEMAAKCKEKMAQFGGGGEAAAMRERCKEKMADVGTPNEEPAVAEPSEPATTPVGDRSKALAAA